MLHFTRTRSEEIQEFYPFQRYKTHNLQNTPVLNQDAAKRLKEIKDFESSETDVILATLMKSGTHWLHEIISMLLTQQTEYNKKGLIMDTGFVLQLDMENEGNMETPRFFNTHLPFQYLPKKHIVNGYKIVHLNRNPKDRHVSMYHFMMGKTGVPDWTWTEYFELFVIGNGDLYGGWFNDTKEWLDAKKRYPDSILLLHYEQLIKEPNQTVTNLAKFLNVPYTNEFIRDVIDKCSFKNLKKNKTDASRIIHPEGKSTIFRKGKIGGWKNWFTVSQDERFDELYQKEMAGYDVEFIYTN